MRKKAQVTIFIIVAIVLVAGIVLYFSLKPIPVKSMSKDLLPVYEYYLSCVEEKAMSAAALLGEQGGYIETPTFVPGSSFMPFSSQLDFLGQGVPYWMYVSGNNLLREQTPSLQFMQRELGEYVNERTDVCDFSSFELQGYDIFIEEGVTTATINELDIHLSLSNKVTIFLGEQSAIISNHEVTVNSKLGKFFRMAKEVYNAEKSSMFLEKYALDVMRLYAPGTGTEISCTPEVFVDEDIKEDIVNGLAANIPAVKLDGSYYDLSSKERDYFVTDLNLDIDENLNFLYSPSWPTSIEIYGDRIVEPVGLQEGMGILGFCYVPYHFIYDINFPVLIQFYDNQELFQFPVGVVIAKSQPREALPTPEGISIGSPVCETKNQEVEIYTYDLGLNPVEANIKFHCLNSECPIGETTLKSGEAGLKANFPQCVNGQIIASAEGYANGKVQISTNDESVANILLLKKHEVALDLGSVKQAVVMFHADDYGTTVAYPNTKKVELVEGYYNVTVYVYDNSSLTFPATNERRCVDVPESGLAGFFGAETEKCFDINMPETAVEFAVIGGGKTQEYLIDSTLRDARELNINVPIFGLPNSLEKLQENHLKIEDEQIFLEFE